MILVVLSPETPDGSTRSGSGFKASQKTGQRLKVSSDRPGEAGIRTCDPWLTRQKKTFCGFSMGRFVCLLYDGNSRRLNRKWF